MDPPVHVILQRDSFELHFGKSDGDLIQTNETIRKGTPKFVIWVQGIENFLKSSDPKTRKSSSRSSSAYGRESVVRDCDGHKFMVVD